MYYFFRDLSHQGSLSNGLTFAAAGIVLERYNNLLLVGYINPFTCKTSTEWREENEVELFEVYNYEYEELKSGLISM